MRIFYAKFFLRKNNFFYGKTFYTPIIFVPKKRVFDAKKLFYANHFLRQKKTHFLRQKCFMSD